MDLLFCIYLLLVFLVLYTLTCHLLDKLRNLPPTPFPSVPLIGHLYLFKKSLFHDGLSQISQQYGPVVWLRFGYLPVLLVSSPSAAEECFTKNYDVIFANRPCFLVGKILGSNYTSLPWAPYGDHWRNLRRISSLHLLSTHRLNTLSHVRIDEVRVLIGNLKMRSGQRVNLRSEFYKLMYNVLTQKICGKRYYGNDTNEEAMRFQEMVLETVRVGGESLGDFIPFINRLRLNKSIQMKLMSLQVKRHQFMQDLINENRDSVIVDDSTKKTMIQILLSLQETDPQCFTDETIRSLMLVLIHGGTDGLVWTLEWAMSLLLNSPHILQKAHQEIQNLVGNNRLINETDISELPYLCGIVYETLRIHPPSRITFPHKSSQECIVGGYHFPRGTTLLVHAWAIQNDPKLWVDPEKFNPERFNGAEGLKSVAHIFIPFGAGRRKCPGEALAIRMLGLVLGSLIQCFDWEKESDEMVDMNENTTFKASKAIALVAKCRPRPTMENVLSQI